MTKPRPRPSAPVVLLDLDGTLVNTKRLYFECYRKAVRPYIDQELTDDQIRALRPRSELQLLNAVVAKEHLEACLEDFQRAYEQLHDTYFQGIYDGVPEMLATIRQRRLPTGIVTGKSRRAWKTTTTHAPLGDFDVLVFDNDVAQPKPDPEGLQIALRKLEARPEETVYLGDSASDMEAAANAGIRPAAAVWAKSPKERARFIERIRPFNATVYETPKDFVQQLR